MQYVLRGLISHGLVREILLDGAGHGLRRPTSKLACNRVELLSADRRVLARAPTPGRAIHPPTIHNR